MSPAVAGAAAGAVLAICALAFGFWAMPLVALFMAGGAAAGRMLPGRSLSGGVDVRGLLNALGGRRTSS